MLLEGDDHALPQPVALELLLSDLDDCGALHPPLRVTDTALDDALDEVCFADQAEVAAAGAQRCERALAQIERFIDDRVLCARRERDAADQRQREVEARRDAAAGADARTAAERALRQAQEEHDALDAECARLLARDDAGYRRWRARALQRSYDPPQVERLLDAQFGVA